MLNVIVLNGLWYGFNFFNVLFVCRNCVFFLFFNMFMFVRSVRGAFIVFVSRSSIVVDVFVYSIVYCVLLFVVSVCVSILVLMLMMSVCVCLVLGSVIVCVMVFVCVCLFGSEYLV